MKKNIQTVSADVPDWSRESVTPGRYEPWKRLIRTIRQYQTNQGRLTKLTRPLIILRHRFWSVVCGSDIPINAQLGGGVIILHPQGVVIHPDAVVGPNCLILQQVTLGTGPKPGLPRIGGHVDIGAGAKILGGVVIGDHAQIGANAVVLQDIPSGTTAVGIPARIIGNNREPNG
ncbi:serine O-acetyltransferase [Desulfogranum japonicum]|uniref:serine O-acetyltransferase n=1 Tax=Desulfogranum japonicum TaxID=231447 RepID=UPI00040B5B9C|nr:serine acetyltransferase [Desulfogranum japonicum]